MATEGEGEDTKLWEGIRTALLLAVDTIEKHKLHCEHTSAQLRDIGRRVCHKVAEGKKA